MGLEDAQALRITPKSNIPWVAAVAVFMAALALLREIAFFPSPDLIPNPDNAWLIYAAGRLADGQKLYVDILETNPPLIVWLNLLPVWLGRVFHINPLVMLPLLVTALNLYSLFICARIIRRRFDKREANLLITYIAFGLFIVSTMTYAQREHIFIALVLPYLLWSLDSGERKAVWAVVIMSAVGFAIKPFFMLIWGINELERAVESRKISTIFAAHNWFIGCFQAAYFMSVYLFTPEYLETIMPALFISYFAFETPLPDILKIVAYIIAPVFFLVLLARLRDCKNGAVRLIIRAMLWMLACAMLMVLQRKIWFNHQYPLLFMAGLVLALLLSYLIGEWRRLRLEIRHRKFAALAGVIAIFAGALIPAWQVSYKMVTEPSKVSEKLIEAINTHAFGKYIYPLVYNMQPSFPAIALGEGVLRGGFHQLWPMPGLVILERRQNSFPSVDKSKKWFYDKIVSDFTGYPPQLVLVDENVNLEKIGEYDISPAERDIIAFLARDARFAAIWKNYEKIGEIIGDEPKNPADGEKPKKPEIYSLYMRKTHDQ